MNFIFKTLRQDKTIFFGVNRVILVRNESNIDNLLFRVITKFFVFSS